MRVRSLIRTGFRTADGARRLRRLLWLAGILGISVGALFLATLMTDLGQSVFGLALIGAVGTAAYLYGRQRIKRLLASRQAKQQVDQEARAEIARESQAKEELDDLKRRLDS